MFDTVVFCAKGVNINENMLIKHHPKVVTFIDEVTGALNTKYTIKDEKIPYITYTNGNCNLNIQVSIPNFLYGNNVTLVTEADIPKFFNCLQERICQLFSIHIEHNQWITKRCDISWNFQVGNKVSEYIQHLSKQKLPFKNTLSYNHDQTVEFSNKSSRIIFYDKFKQIVKMKKQKEIIEQAKGILRLEVKPSYSEMKKFSTLRLAKELLNKSFFEYITLKVIEELRYPVDANSINLTWLLKNTTNISKIETLLGYQQLQSKFDETTLKGIYTSGTFANRKNLAKQITFPVKNFLSPLVIDYANIS